MVSVVVHYADSGNVAKVLKASLDPTEPIQSLAHLIQSRAEREARADGRERVLHVVVSGDTQRHVAQLFSVVGDSEGCCLATWPDVTRHQSCVGRCETVANDLGTAR